MTPKCRLSNGIPASLAIRLARAYTGGPTRTARAAQMAKTMDMRALLRIRMEKYHYKIAFWGWFRNNKHHRRKNLGNYYEPNRGDVPPANLTLDAQWQILQEFLHMNRWHHVCSNQEQTIFQDCVQSQNQTSLMFEAPTDFAVEPVPKRL